MTGRNITFSRGVVLLVTSILLSALSGCGFSARQLSKGQSDQYTYKDPRGDTPAPLRESEETDDERAADESAGLQFSNEKVQLKDNTVTVTLDKTAHGATQHITMSGALIADHSAYLDDTAPVDGQSRMKGSLHCLGDNCSELVTDVYFYLDGVKTSRQLNVRDVESDLKAKIAAVQPPSTETVGHKYDQPFDAPSDLPAAAGTPPRIVSPPLALQPSSPSSDETADSEPEANHGHDESMADTTLNGDVMTPTLDDTRLQNLLPDVPKSQIKPKKKVAIVQSTPDEPFDINNIIFSGGGVSVNRANGGGKILQGATLLPVSGPGFHRVSPDPKANGTGYSISFIEEAAVNYNKLHPECGLVTVNDISNPRGGILHFKDGGHAESHQNGLDFDMAYLPLTNLKSVVVGGKLDKNFAMTCNYDWSKYITNLRMSDNGRTFVSGILVNPVIKRGYCDHQKANGLYSPEDVQMQSHIFMWDGHDNHAHVRLNCSPEHFYCQNTDFNAATAKCQ